MGSRPAAILLVEEGSHEPAGASPRTLLAERGAARRARPRLQSRRRHGHRRRARAKGQANARLVPVKPQRRRARQMDYCKQFLVEPGKRFKIAEGASSFVDPKLDKADAERMTEANRARIADGHMRLYAEGRHSLLIVLQGLDTAGKDGVVTHILRLVNPLGCRATSFKQPSAEEAAHDFLWRAHRVTPPAGAIAIFNRSHYEGVLVERVHSLIDRKRLDERYRQINDFERLLAETGTTIIKVFLNIS